MNSTTSPETPVQRITNSGMISDDDFSTLTDVLAYIMVLVSTVGVVTNSINIKTFISMGLDDGITVSLMGLAISDFGFTFFGCVLGFSNVISSLEMKHGLDNLPIQPSLVFGMFSANFGYMFYQVTCMITTFMAVARCMCVAMPFQFKNFFTKSKSVSAMIVFALIAMAFYLPLISQMGAHRRFDPKVNRIRIVLWLSDKRGEYKNVISFIHFVVFVFISTAVVVVCVVIMAKYLRQSGKFRHSQTTASGDNNDSTGYKLSGKELQVVRQVILICVIYTVCMLPTVVYAIFRLVDDDFRVGGRLHNLHFFVASVGMILELVNSATTLPVYYAYNSKFRSRFPCFSKGSVTVTTANQKTPQEIRVN